MKLFTNRIPEHRLLPILFLIGFLSLIPLLGGTPLFDEDEGYFAEVTREMVESGNYVTAHLNGRPEYDKPILIYWLQAAGYRIFGVNEFGARFPSGLATLLWSLALFFFVRRHLDAHKAFMAALFMVSAVQVTVTGKAAISDAVLNLFLALSMFAFYDFFVFRKKRDLYLGCLFMGLGFLTKGPVAVAVPVAVTFLFCLIRKEMKLWVKSVFDPAGILIFAAVALPWYLLEYLDQGDAFIQDFFFKHNLERFQKPMEGHAGSLLYYIPVILFGTLPFSGLLVPAVRHLKQDLKHPLMLFGGIWFAFVFVLFSVAGTKLPHYVVYGYTPLFIFYAAAYLRLERFRLVGIPTLAFLGILTLLPALVPVVAPFVTDRFAVLVMASAGAEFGPGYYLAAAVLLGVLILSMVARIHASWRAVLAASILLVFVNLLFIPRIGNLMQAPVREAARIARDRGYSVVMWGYYLPSFIFYSERFVQQRDPAAGDILITRKNRLEELKSWQVIYEKNGIVLARVITP